MLAGLPDSAAFCCGDVALRLDQLGRHLVPGQRHRLAGGDVHREVLAPAPRRRRSRPPARRSWRRRARSSPAGRWPACARSAGSTCSRRSCRPAPCAPLDGRAAQRQRRQRRDVGRAPARPPARPGCAAKARKSSFLATKSVSQLTSTIAPSLASGAMNTATTPSAATRLAALLALLPSRTRRISSALPRSPPASVSAFLHSIIGASVFSRSSLTMPAVISAICLLPGPQPRGYERVVLGAAALARSRPAPESKKGALRRPPFIPCRGASLRRCFLAALHLDELVGARSP